MTSGGNPMPNVPATPGPFDDGQGIAPDGRPWQRWLFGLGAVVVLALIVWSFV